MDWVTGHRSVRDLGETFEKLDNDEKNKMLMGMLKQSKKAHGYVHNLKNMFLNLSLKDDVATQTYQLKDHVVCKHAFCQVLNINIKRVAGYEFTKKCKEPENCGFIFVGLF